MKNSLVRRLSAAAIGFSVLLCPAAGDDSEWRNQLQQGEASEDAQDFKAAGSSFGRACELAVTVEGSEPQRIACIRLAQFHAVEGKLSDAAKTVQQLLERLQALDSPRPLDIVETLLALAEIQAAQSRTDAVYNRLRDAASHVSHLNAAQRAHALARMSEFYFAANSNPAGRGLLNRARVELRQEVDHEAAAYIRAATHFVAVRRWYDPPSEWREFLEPVVERTRARFSEPAEISADLREASLAAVEEYLRNLPGGEDEEPSQTLREDLKRWRESDPGATGAPVLRVKDGEVLAPQLLRKREPAYTPGARDARVTGFVVLAIEVWPDGQPHNIRVIQPKPFGLSWAAVRAVRRWRFKPGTKGGDPVKVAATVEVNFQFGQPPGTL